MNMDDEYKRLFKGSFFIEEGGRRGHTTTPLLSAECQNRVCEVFWSLLSRSLEFFHNATLYGHFGRHFVNKHIFVD